jgi:hypothetical protein
MTIRSARRPPDVPRARLQKKIPSESKNFKTPLPQTRHPDHLYLIAQIAPIAGERQILR